MAKLETLSDDFNSTLDTATKWTDTYGTVGTTGGRAFVEAASDYPQIATDTVWNFTDTYAHVRCWPMSYGNGSKETMLTIRHNSSTTLQIFKTDNNLGMRLRSGGSNDDWYISYDSTSMAYWRIVEWSGNAYFDTSPNGVTWTNQREILGHGEDFTSVALRLEAGWWDTEDPETAYYDNFNVATATSSVDIGLISRIYFPPDEGDIYYDSDIPYDYDVAYDSGSGTPVYTEPAMAIVLELTTSVADISTTRIVPASVSISISSAVADVAPYLVTTASTAIAAVSSVSGSAVLQAIASTAITAASDVAVSARGLLYVSTSIMPVLTVDLSSVTQATFQSTALSLTSSVSVSAYVKAFASTAIAAVSAVLASGRTIGYASTSIAAVSVVSASGQILWVAHTDINILTAVDVVAYLHQSAAAADINIVSGVEIDPVFVTLGLLLDPIVITSLVEAAAFKPFRYRNLSVDLLIPTTSVDIFVSELSVEVIDDPGASVDVL